MSKTTSQIVDREKELKSALADLVKAQQAIVDAPTTDANGTIQLEKGMKEEFQANQAKMSEIREMLEGIEELKSGQKWLAQPEDAPVGFVGGSSTPSFNDLGQAFIESAEFKARQGANMITPFEVKASNIGALYSKDVYAGTPGTVGDFTAQAVQRDPMIERNRRQRRVRDLFPVQQTTAATIEFFQVVGFTNNASTVGQRNAGNTAFALKPQSSLSFSSQQSPVRTIANWEAVHRHVLDDEPALRGVINNELLYGLRLQEDVQILTGSGLGDDLLGILNTPGIQSYSWSAGETEPVPDTMADSIRRAATLAYLAEYQPTGVVVHPFDWEKIELTKNTSGDYLLAVSIALGGEERVWRMPVIDTPAMPEGRALLGAFGIGAQIYDREEANIRVAEQHADFFVRNAIVVLAEERIGLATKRPESFVEIIFDNEPA